MDVNQACTTCGSRMVCSECSEDVVPISKLSKDLREAAKGLGPQEARFLVDSYYIVQETRKRLANQIRSMGESGEPSTLLNWYFDQQRSLEKFLKTALDVYSANHEVGVWMRSIKGVGPVIAAGFLAHIDITKAVTAGSIWRFAGLEPTMEWNKGQRRPWNASLKVLCWKLGASFVKVSGGDHPSPYGMRYRRWKQIYQDRNDAGDYKDLSAKMLETKNFSKTTEAYKAYAEGRLPPGRIDLRARRKAVKLFISHLHDFWYRHHFQQEPPVPYIFTHSNGQHVHFIPRPDKCPEETWANLF